MSLRHNWYEFAALSLDDLYAIMRLRQAVFVVEQDCAFQDADGLDPSARHLLIRQGRDLVAYLRVHAPGELREELVISRVITALSHRRQGLGIRLLNEAVEAVRQRYPQAQAWLGAQQRLQAFYARFGFEPCSEPYLEDGIWHVGMAASVQGLRRVGASEAV